MTITFMYLTWYSISRKPGPKNIIQNMKEKNHWHKYVHFSIIIFIIRKNKRKAI